MAALLLADKISIYFMMLERKWTLNSITMFSGMEWKPKEKRDERHKVFLVCRTYAQYFIN